MSQKRIQEMLKILDEHGYSLADLSELFNSISQIGECMGEQLKDDEKKKSCIEEPLTEKEQEQIKLKIRITNSLLELGFSTNVRGFNYIRDAILMVYNNPNYINKHIIDLYCKLANKYGVTYTCIERGIRYSISVAWKLGSVSAYEKYFGFSIDSKHRKPYNSQLISTVADYLKLHP